jgi:AraC-like DNA-binding protein
MPNLRLLTGPPPRKVRIPLLEGEEPVVRPKVVPVPEFGVIVFESRHGPGFIGELRDEFSKFLLIIGGRATWEAKGNRITVSTDSLVHIPACLPHRQQDSVHNPVVLYAIHYRPNLLPAFLRHDLQESGLIHWNLSTYLPFVARAFRSDFQEMLFEQAGRREGYEWLLCSRLVELAVRAVRIHHQEQPKERPMFIKGSDSAERVARYAQQLQTHFYLCQTLDEAAASLGLSRRQFTEVFRKVTGKSWKKYLLALRLDHAKKLLLGTEKTVTATAFECGFEDLSYFDRAFKKEFACSPQAIRQLRHPPNRIKVGDPPSSSRASA